MSAVNPTVAGKAQDGVKPCKCCKILWLMNVKYGEHWGTVYQLVFSSAQVLVMRCQESILESTAAACLLQVMFKMHRLRNNFPGSIHSIQKLSSVQAELWVDFLTELTLMVYVVKDLIFVSCSWMNGWGSRFRLVVLWIGLNGSPCSCNPVAQSIAIVCHTQKRMLTAGHTLFWCIMCTHWPIGQSSSNLSSFGLSPTICRWFHLMVLWVYGAMAQNHLIGGSISAPSLSHPQMI